MTLFLLAGDMWLELLHLLVTGQQNMVCFDSRFPGLYDLKITVHPVLLLLQR